MLGNVGHAHAAALCNTDFRGDQACIQIVDGQILATGNYNPNAVVFLEIVRQGSDRIVAGPIGDTSLQASLPPGRYYASYYVQSNLPSTVGCQVDSPTVTL
jgi:hypothetical protein